MNNQNMDTISEAPFKVVGIHHGKVVRGGKSAPLTAATKEEAYRVFKSVLTEFKKAFRIKVMLDEDWVYTEQGDALTVASQEYDCVIKIIPSNE